MAYIALKKIAESKGYTISKTQRETGLVMNKVRRYWYSEVSGPDIDDLEILADLLGVEPGDFIARGKRPKELDKRSTKGRPPKKKPPD